MARECIVCNKKTTTGFNVSHSHVKTKRRWLPNLQRVKAVINGETRRVYICTKCLKAGKIQRA
ncbi:MAG: 50S ribosomal protein L28 [bacterium]